MLNIVPHANFCSAEPIYEAWNNTFYIKLFWRLLRNMQFSGSTY